MEDLYDVVRSLWVVWLMVLFLGIVVWVVWPSNKKKLERHARIPLEEDEDTGDEERGDDGKGT